MKPNKMAFSKTLLAFLMCAPLLAHAESIVGTLAVDNAHLSLKISGGEKTQLIPLTFSGNAEKESQSLVGKTPFVIVNGKWSDDKNSFEASEVPTQLNGNVTLEGQLVSRGKDGYSIGKTPAIFGKTKEVTKASFDNSSRNYFMNQRVIANGTLQNGIFVIQSIIKAGIFSAAPAVPQEFSEKLANNPTSYVKDMIAGHGKSNQWFRETLFATPSKPVQPNDTVMILTAAGAEGGSPGGANGHFAAGRGTVDENLEIKAELFNIYYYPNEKEILPGNVNMIDYYGNIISGQANYRPTYTLLLYGVSLDKINKVRDELDNFYPLFRSGNIKKITSNVNCATLSVQALADIGVYGTHRNDKNGTPEFPLLSTQVKLPGKLSLQENLVYLSKTRRAEFMPGPALMSILSNLDYINKKENLGITRVDFVYGAQTPSNRDTGGAPTNSLSNDLVTQGKVTAEVGVEKGLHEGEGLIKKVEKDL